MYNILVNTIVSGGVLKYRISEPHQLLQELFPNDYHIEYNNNVDFTDNSYIQKFDIIIFHKFPIINGNPIEVITNIKKLGVKVIIDIDDYFRVNITNPQYEYNNKLNFPAIIEECLKYADLVTTTTEYFANILRLLNNNVVVLPNGLDFSITSNATKSDLLRIGWLGGSSHLEDLKLLDNLCQQSIKDTQMVLCGYDIRGKVQEYNMVTKQTTERNMKPKETIWYKYEKLFSNNYKGLSKHYKEYLLQYKFDPNYNDKFNPYRRIWTKDIDSYMEGYDEFDISLAPLTNTIFNNCKSELKVLESALKKKAVIASDEVSYNGIINNSNGILVNKRNEWTKAVMKLKNNPNLITDLGEQLYLDVKDKFDLRNITRLRNDIYKQLINE